MFKRKKNASTAAKALGWFSIGLGVTELLGGGFLGRAIGLKRGRDLMVRAFGVREIAAGIGLLRNVDEPKPWLWARVAGDALDLGALGRAMISPGNRRDRLGVATAAVLGATIADVVSAANA